ncbi:MAG: GTPase Era [Bacillota bacterium]
MAEEVFRSGFVGVVGRPNVGKSTLVNALVGRKVAIVSEKPQTTRNRILGVLNGPGYQMVLLDTPGMMEPRTELDQYMVKIARGTLGDVDVLVLVVDGTARPGPNERLLVASFPRKAPPVVLALNKVDLLPADKVPEAMEAYRALYPFRHGVPISALTGTNLDLLRQAIYDLLPPGPRYYPEDVTTDQPDHFYVAEVVREKVLELVRDEVPYSVAVVVEEIAPRPNEVLYIRAYIFCERAGQRGILVGQNARLLKTVGTRARQELEAYFGKKIYLDLWVKVRRDWRDDPSTLGQLGYRLK